MAIAKCAICGVDFDMKDNRDKYCSPHCAKVAQRKWQKVYAERIEAMWAANLWREFLQSEAGVYLKERIRREREDARIG